MDDEAMLINLRYALADALEHCRGMSAESRSEAVVIEEMIKFASSQVMLLLAMPHSLSKKAEPAPLLSSAA